MSMTTSAAPLWRALAFNKQTRRGRVLRITQEHYLRDDISCCSELCPVCPLPQPREDIEATMLTKSPEGNKYLVLDTNAFLHQMDLLENAADAINNVIVTQTVMEEVKHRNISLYRRLYSLIKTPSRRFILFANKHHHGTFVDRRRGETANDYNDRAIRKVVSWYKDHLAQSGKTKLSIVLVTNDSANKNKAKAEGLQAVTIQEHVATLKQKHPELLELVAQPNVEDADQSEGPRGKSGAKSTTAAGQKGVYAEHVPLAELNKGLKAGKYFKGTLRCARDNWQNAYVVVAASGSDRIGVAIQGRDCVNRGVDGDIVAIEILPQSEWRTDGQRRTQKAEGEGDTEVDGTDARATHANAEIAEIVDTSEETTIAAASSRTLGTKPCGRVVGIIKRNWRTLCGSIEPVEGPVVSSYSLFVPVDRKIPKVKMLTRQREALLNKRIMVTIDDWPSHSRFPIGHYVRTLGDIGDKDTETKVILIEHHIPTEEFSPKVIACLPPADWVVTPENSQGRRDLRHLPVMSIDPPGCKDIDDALHVIKLENGNYQVGVHIADVTHFVAAGSPMDLEAANRGTSTYLVERRLDMLPGLLTTDICSLRGGIDRFAFSVLWEITPDVEIVGVDFTKSIIHSVAAMSYQQAQDLLDSDREDVKASSVKMLNHIAKTLRQRRLDAGALTLASPEVRFTLDAESQNPLDVQLYQLKETNALVEEFMLLANITVAKKILRHYPTFSMLRRHPAPSHQQFDDLIAEVEALGFSLNVDTSKTLAESLDAIESTENPFMNKLIRILTTRCMRPAEYFCSGEFAPAEYHHYGLAAPIYTHFTSPIRRYADVVVHRLLAAAIGVSALPHQLENKLQLHEVAENLNRRHLAAQQAGRASVQLHTLLYFKDRETEEDAVVMKVKANGLNVLVPRYGIEAGIILYNEKDQSSGSNPLEFDEKTMILGHRDNPDVRVRIFDQVRVQIYVEKRSGFRNELMVRLIQPRFPGSEAVEETSNKQSLSKRASSKVANGSSAKKQKL